MVHTVISSARVSWKMLPEAWCTSHHCAELLTDVASSLGSPMSTAPLCSRVNEAAQPGPCTGGTESLDVPAILRASEVMEEKSPFSLFDGSGSLQFDSQESLNTSRAAFMSG